MFKFFKQSEEKPQEKYIRVRVKFWEGVRINWVDCNYTGESLKNPEEKKDILLKEMKDKQKMINEAKDEDVIEIWGGCLIKKKNFISMTLYNN